MPRTKISKAAIDLNVAVPTIIEFLRKKGITVDDSPNARIDEDVYEILVNEYKPDRALKSKSEQMSVDRQAAKTKPAPRPEEIKLEPEPARGPKVLGKIDLSSGKQVHDTPKASEKPKVPEKEVPVKATPVKDSSKPVAEKPAEPAKETPAPKPAAEPKPAPAPKAQTAKAETAQPKPEPVKEAPAAQPEPAKKAEAPQDAEKEPEVFTLGTPKVGPQINVIGKIDLSTINQSTRPKKKGKEERRAAAKTGAPGAPAGDKKKRKRIGGKEKIDIENPGQHMQSPGRNENKSRDDRRG
ncbi:MAG: hypothetical protein K2M52_01310, partial [Paramuribaculum sp.]|nr:hypothetical protein [Paramuribaculum sp.]